MKTKKLFVLFPLFTLLVGCTMSFGPSPSGDTPGGDTPSGDEPSGDEPSEISKTTLTYTYDDYEKHHRYPISHMPSTGTVNYLVIPVWLSDSSNYYSTSSRSTYTTRMNKAFFGTESDVGWESVKSYYEELSSDALTLQGEVAPFYETSYATTDINQTVVSQIVVDAVVNWKSTKTNAEIREYDSDNNGYLDAVSLIYFAPDYSSSTYTSSDPQKENTSLWAYVYWVQDSDLKNPSNPGPNDYMWASYDFLNQKGSLTIDTHTIIHETGHLLGLDDYYDYSSERYTYAGGFSMQDLNVGSHDPFSVMALGWAKPYVPTESCEITIGDFQETKELILLSPSFSNSPFDEYLLLELYAPTGLNRADSRTKYSSRPKGPTSLGIRLWHVDARLYYENAFGKHVVTAPAPGHSYLLCNTNNYDDGEIDQTRLSDITAMRNYHLLTLIRREDNNASRTKSNLSASDLFTNYSSFSMDNYSGYFPNSGELNKGGTLGFSFTVKSISVLNNKATIKITKITNPD